MNDHECAVCFEPIDEVLICGHKIHLLCVQKSHKAECPLCRHPVNTELIKRVTRRKRPREIMYFSYDGIVKNRYEIIMDETQNISIKKFV